MRFTTTEEVQRADGWEYLFFMPYGGSTDLCVKIYQKEDCSLTAHQTNMQKTVDRFLNSEEIIIEIAKSLSISYIVIRSVKHGICRSIMSSTTETGRSSR